MPQYRRRAYAVAIYTAARASEIEAITKLDVDVAHARLSIAKQVDRETGGDRQTKTRRARSFDIEPELLPLLRALADDAPEGRLVKMPPDEDQAELLRKDLRTAGVVRDELFVENDPARQRLTFHNLRDTGLTWMAVRGDDPLRIQWRGGHTDFKMTQAYLAAGRNLGPSFGVPFGPLPRSLFAVADVAVVVEPRSEIGPGTEIKKTKPRNPQKIPGFRSATPTGIEPVLPT
ncbi:MAG: tyrosine-type recombinase/integrase [Polyangiales bacterium]